MLEYLKEKSAARKLARRRERAYRSIASIKDKRVRDEVFAMILEG